MVLFSGAYLKQKVRIKHETGKFIQKTYHSLQNHHFSSRVPFKSDYKNMQNCKFTTVFAVRLALIRADFFCVTLRPTPCLLVLLPVVGFSVDCLATQRQP
jgi:hypothetical protein